MAMKTEELMLQVEVLQQEVARLTKALDEADKRMNEALNGVNALPGWVLKARNPNYSGVTAGFQFRKGVALVAEQEGMEQKIKTVCSDFGVTAEKVADLRSKVQFGNTEAAKQMIDIIGLPEVL